jgi:putative Mg2+ transporter-C (MgtC) family protein
MREFFHQMVTADSVFLSQTMARLLLAAFLGGAIGLEREVHHKPAGLRTNLFICVGAAMFTVLSDKLAGAYGGDHTRIAAQIIPGIGFIGAGSILHSRGSVTGLTTAATLFMVASIGMAAGGGLYVVAIFATIIVAIALNLLGWFEQQFNLKPLVMTYEVVGAQADAVLADINQILHDERRMMQTVHIGRTNGDFRVQFTLDATRREHKELFERIRHVPSAKSAEVVGRESAE